jgi:hypothetical protein
MLSEESNGTGDGGVEQEEHEEFNGESAGERSRCSAKDGPGEVCAD